MALRVIGFQLMPTATVARGLLWLCVLSIGIAAQEPQGWLTNARVAILVQSGVNSKEIIRIIGNAPKVQFDLRPASTDLLLTAGVSEEIIEAMAAREMGTPVVRADRRPLVQSPPGAAASSKQSSSPASPPPPARAEQRPSAATASPAEVKRSDAHVEAPVEATRQPAVPLGKSDLASKPAVSVSELLTDAQVDRAIQQGIRSRHAIGLRLNDVQTAMLSAAACHACSQSGYTITLYTPEQWIELAAKRAMGEMLPLSAGDVPVDMRRPMLHVVALPSTPEHLNGAGLSFSSSVHRVVLSDTRRQTIIQPFELSNGAVKPNSALKSASFGTPAASFLMADVGKLRAGDPKGEFFVVVLGDNQNNFFKVKSNNLKKIF